MSSVTVERRKLGKTNVEASAMVLGCYSMSSAYGARDDAESMEVIHRAIDNGINLLDTADYYGRGHNERLIAKAIRDRRGDVLVSSKFGYVREEGGPLTLCGTPEHVRASCEASLQRLETDHIDLYFQHRLDPNVPIEETVGAMADLVQQGKVRYLGLCEVSEAVLRRANDTHPITALQAEYSLWTREVEQGMDQACSNMGTTLMAFAPLARGMLTGSLRSLDQLGPEDVRRNYPRFSDENFPKNVALVDRLGAIASRLSCSLSQLAIAWLLHKNRSVVALCGCDTLSFLDENIKALAVTLEDDAVAEISEMFAPGKVFGDRYQPELMRMLNR